DLKFMQYLKDKHNKLGVKQQNYGTFNQQVKLLVLNHHLLKDGLIILIILLMNTKLELELMVKLLDQQRQTSNLMLLKKYTVLKENMDGKFLLRFVKQVIILLQHQLFYQMEKKQNYLMKWLLI